MDFSNIEAVERATQSGRRDLFRLGTGLIFISGIMLATLSETKNVPGGTMLVIAAMIGGYMAMNIGANDVANNVGPAVGSHALTLSGAIAIAAVFEGGGALIAGGDVVSTIKKGIIDPSAINDSQVFIWMMTAALLAGAIWLNVATAVGAPVSTTHSIVGGVLGAGIAAGGWDIVNWPQVGAIAASWVISPVLGGVIAAGFLYLIKRRINYQTDQIAAAKMVVPLLLALMAWAFSSYIVLKGLKHIWKTSLPEALLVGLIVAMLVYLVVRPRLQKQHISGDNTKADVNDLFTVPLIFAAALLSFAHGANDVANAVGPLAAINDALLHATVSSQAGIPLWVLLVGASGIALGLALYGPKLIRTVGSEITELNKTRAFCIAMAAAVTVIVASQLGLPVSSTHIAVGGVFGIGFLREHIKVSYAKAVNEVRYHHQGKERAVVEAFLKTFEQAPFEQKNTLLRQLKRKSIEAPLSKKERRDLRRIYGQELVKRTAVLKIVAAWVITLPVSATLAAIFFFTLRGMMLP